MTWVLFRKDLRLYRLPFIGGLVLLFPVYLMAAYLAVDTARNNQWDDRVVTMDQPGTGRPPVQVTMKQLMAGEIVAEAVIPAALVGLGLTAILAAVCAGMAFAAERRDRTAQFI